MGRVGAIYKTFGFTALGNKIGGQGLSGPVAQEQKALYSTMSAEDRAKLEQRISTNPDVSQKAKDALAELRGGLTGQDQVDTEVALIKAQKNSADKLAALLKITDTDQAAKVMAQLDSKTQRDLLTSAGTGIKAGNLKLVIDKMEPAKQFELKKFGFSNLTDQQRLDEIVAMRATDPAEAERFFGGLDVDNQAQIKSLADKTGGTAQTEVNELFKTINTNKQNKIKEEIKKGQDIMERKEKIGNLSELLAGRTATNSTTGAPILINDIMSSLGEDDLKEVSAADFDKMITQNAIDHIDPSLLRNLYKKAKGPQRDAIVNRFLTLAGTPGTTATKEQNDIAGILLDPVTKRTLLT
jgi:hypothetical protein